MCNIYRFHGFQVYDRKNFQTIFIKIKKFIIRYFSAGWKIPNKLRNKSRDLFGIFQPAEKYRIMNFFILMKIV